jgi:hypothetical protein
MRDGGGGMGYLVEVERQFRAVQGLPSPVRARRGLPPNTGGISVVVRAGVEFGEEALTARGWFFDTDAAAEELAECCAGLDERPWTAVFDFRPTFELVSRHLYRRLVPRLPGLTYLEIEDQTFGVRTRYQGDRDGPAQDLGTAESGGAG